ALSRSLRKLFTFDTALSGAEALQKLDRDGPYAVVVADQTMPSMSGVELLEAVREIAPDTVRLMLTGNADQKSAVEAVNRGAVFRFLNKPCPPETLVPALETALKQHELVVTERELTEGTLSGSVQVLSEVLGMIAPDVLGRGQRLRESMGTFARHLQLEPVWEYEVAAGLALLGYASLPVIILRKISAGTDLEPEEAEILRHTPEVGYNLVSSIPRFANIAQMILYQAKDFTGTGVPADAVAGEEIPLGARMLRILNDRLTLELEGIVKQNALIALRERRGSYDPALVEKCFECFPTFLSNALSSEIPVVYRHLDQLAPGQVLVSEIKLANNVVLVAAGERLTKMVIQRIRNAATIGQIRGPWPVQEPPPAP
ncbi:MAG TPA: HD domain-containing phosphohydrolase, partial [Opitutaceae bacterium]|nr:HD domain-containing phosphohydrolase [Opitutaceae bacterium]